MSIVSPVTLGLLPIYRHVTCLLIIPAANLGVYFNIPSRVSQIATSSFPITAETIKL